MDINGVSFIKSSSFHDSEDKSKTQFLLLSKQGKVHMHHQTSGTSAVMI